MKNEIAKPKTIDEYISSSPSGLRTVLEKIRTTIQLAAPKAEETIKNSMPTYLLNGTLVQFAVCKNYIGFYSTPSSMDEFKKELSDYVCINGAAQFPMYKSVPCKIISRIVRFRVKEIVKEQKEKKLSAIQG